tara:strand:- start:342 stop:1151 length:810 start_codon:yes stop_codon:yes gene_type:complete
MADAFAMPSLPPASPWDAYVLMLIVPFILRLVFVAPPLIDLVNTYAPPGERTKHVRWFLTQIRLLPVKGFWLILINETMAFILPALVAIGTRYWLGPIGWPTWDETPSLGVALLLMAGALWLYSDFSKVMRSRRDIKSIAKYNLSTAKMVVQGAVTGRKILQNVTDSGIPRPWREVVDVNFEVDGEATIVPERNPLTEIIYDVLDRGADALEEILGRVKEPATAAMERLDREIQDRITQRVQASAKSLFKNVLFSIAPIAVLIGLDRLI